MQRAIATVGRYFSKASSKKIIPIVDLQSQTRVLSDGSRICRYQKTDDLKNSLFPDALTLYDGIRRGARISKNGPMLGRRVKQSDGSEPYIWLKYNEIIDRSVAVAYALRHLGVRAGQNSFIGVYSKNRPEWIIVEYATYTFSNVLVPLYETLGPVACVFSLNQTEIEIVFCDTVEKAKGLKSEKSQCPFLKYIVVMDDEEMDENDKAEFAAAGLKLFGFKEFEALGAAAKKIPLQPPKPDDLATICYTSGTTGTPKGVMLTHGNIIADGTTLEYFKHTNINSEDVMMSFLPLSHMFERLVESAMFIYGAKVGFYRGDITKLQDDIKTLQPTILPVVPRVLNRLFDKVQSEINKTCFRKTIFKIAFNYKLREINQSIIRNDGFFDKLVFKRIRDQLGGRLKGIITGSAPIANNVINFVRCAFGCIVVEGYGQTECVAASTITLEGDAIPDHVGVPSPCNVIKLVDVPELGYFAKENAGEVCIKGTNVFKGYYKDEEQTKQTLDSEGWLHTGDIGRWTEAGTLKIIDRKKHIFKLAQGEYVAPEKIENIYLRSKYISQIFVHGESLKTCLIAIIVPDRERLSSEASKILGLPKLGMKELCQREDIKKLIMDNLMNIGKSADLCSFEQVKDIYLSPKMFTVENGLLTPTLKSKRPMLEEYFKAQIDEMYEKLD